MRLALHRELLVADAGGEVRRAFAQLAALQAVERRQVEFDGADGDHLGIVVQPQHASVAQAHILHHHFDATVCRRRARPQVAPIERAVGSTCDAQHRLFDVERSQHHLPARQRQRFEIDAHARHAQCRVSCRALADAHVFCRERGGERIEAHRDNLHRPLQCGRTVMLDGLPRQPRHQPEAANQIENARQQRKLQQPAGTATGSGRRRRGIGGRDGCSGFGHAGIVCGVFASPASGTMARMSVTSTAACWPATPCCSARSSPVSV